MSVQLFDIEDKSIESQRLIESPPLQERERHGSAFSPVKPMLLFSLAMNLVLFFMLLSSKSSSETTRYASLTWDVPSEWVNSSKYMDRHHKTRTDEAWAAMNWDAGMVAISDEEATELGVPLSQRFPWDQSKGIYLINGYHNLHCLQWLWRSMAKFRDGKPFERLDWHGFHCLDALRQDTICYADDTPRYTGKGQNNETSGFQQARQCRDWSKLEKWAEERSSCYRFLGNSVDDVFDRHKFCPEDSPYNDVIEDFYGPNERQRLIGMYGDMAA